MLSGIGIQPPEDVGRSVFLELDGGDEAQKRIPVLADQGLIDGFVRGDDPIMIPWPVRFEDVEGLFSNAFDPWGEGKAQQMCHA